MSKKSIIIGGDIVPTKSNYSYFNRGDILSLIGIDLKQILTSCDFRIFNLETPLCDIKSPIKKWGPNLITPTNTINGIKALDPSLLVIGNNHIMDQDTQGYVSTIETLYNNRINYVGSGENLIQAALPYIFETNGMKIGIYACAEHEFSIATENKAGGNPFDPLESLDHIRTLKSICDYVIVLYHGGKEHYRYPSPYLQKVCRKMVDKGANLIVCQQSHCIGSYEEHCGSVIVYGQGNFIFDYSENELEQTGLLIKASFDDEMKIEFIPIYKWQNCVRKAEGKLAEDILVEFYQRSDDILKDGFIEQEYQKYAQEVYPLYIRHFSGFGKWLSRIDRRLLNGMLVKRKYNKNQLLAIQNYIECETHRELVIAGLKIEEK